jgi:hypothetical protein
MLTRPVVSSLLLVSFAAAQDVLHYKFDEVHGSKVVNFAPGSPAPSQGTIVSLLPGAPAASWAPGRFGAGALAGCIASPNQPNRVDSGWVPGTVSGSVSYALWLRVAYNQAAPSIGYLFGSPTGGAFRVVSGSGGTLFTAGFGSSTHSCTANVYQLANQGNWVHVAWVADVATMTSTYYIDGVAETPRAITAVPTWTSAVPFTVGQQLTGSVGSIFDIDEFHLSFAAWTPGEVLALASAPRAADAAYGSGCGSLTLGSTGGTPAVGNGAYQLVLGSPVPAIALFGIGIGRASLLGSPLPFDLGTFLGYGPCQVDASLDVALTFVTTGPAPTVLSLPIPFDPSFHGVSFWAQAPGLVGSTFEMSNAFAIAIGG